MGKYGISRDCSKIKNRRGTLYQRLNYEKNSLNGVEDKWKKLRKSEVTDERLREMINSMEDTGIRSNLHILGWADKEGKHTNQK